jgi:hypothetical protein
MARDGPPTVLTGLAGLVTGVLMGLALWGGLRWQERRTFGDLAEAERRTAVAAVVAARPPDDPRQRDAAVRIADTWAKPAWQIGFQVIFWIFFVLLTIYLGIAVTPWGWPGAAFFSLVGWYSLRSELRNRRAGRRFRQAAATAPDPAPGLTRP